MAGVGTWRPLGGRRHSGNEQQRLPLLCFFMGSGTVRFKKYLTEESEINTGQGELEGDCFPKVEKTPGSCPCEPGGVIHLKHVKMPGLALPYNNFLSGSFIHPLLLETRE